MSDFLSMLDESEMTPSMEREPFYKVLDKKEADIHKWLVDVSDALIEQSQSRTKVQREHLLQYRGVSVRKMDRTRDRDRNVRRLSKMQKFVINHLHDLTETKVSQMTRIKPAIEVLPTNDEWEDRASAKVVQKIIKHLWDLNNVDYITQKMHRYARIFGESYLFILWDKDAGDLHPSFVQARDLGLDSFVTEDGQEIDVNKQKLMTGDVCYEVELPWRVFLQRKPEVEKVEYVFRISLEPTEELKDDYKGKKIEKSDSVSVFDTDSLESRFVEDHTVVIEMWHKHTDKIPNGFYAKFTADSLLESSDLPFSHGKLPFVRLTDLDVPDVLNGVSRYETVGAIQGMYNNISTLIAKNIYLTAHAKWVMPRGAAKIEHLGNDHTVIQYQGQVPPQLIQTAPNPAEVYTFREQLKQDMQVVYGSHGISRGEVPKGITAASALQFLNELESERASTDISKHAFMVKDIAKMSMAVAGDKYEPDDGRMVRIVGKNNKFLIRSFDTAHLSKNYDVRFDNSTGLPEQKSAKIQRILEAMQRNPHMLSGERWEELLDLGDTEKMNTLITAAVEAADAENEDILAGREVGEPQEWEDHIQHWQSHVRTMQGRQFKEDVDPVAVAKFKDHLFWTEEAMLDKARRNPEFAAKLATLTLFPIFVHSGFEAPQSREHQAALVQGQANRGEEVTGVIPGISTEDISEEQFRQRQAKGRS